MEMIQAESNSERERRLKEQKREIRKMERRAAEAGSGGGNPERRTQTAYPGAEAHFSAPQESGEEGGTGSGRRGEGD